MLFKLVKKNALFVLQPALGRFCTFYFALLVFPFPINYFSFLSPFRHYYFIVFNTLISWTRQYIFRIPFPLTPNHEGIGDALYNYIQAFVCLLLAAVATFVWHLANRIKPKDAILKWLHAYIRFYFACTLMRYGIEKVIKAQFPFPYASLDEPYGDSTPVRLMWSFMGYSTVYNFFIGSTEIIAGFLMLFRKWTTLGAVLSIAILLNVTILNFCYDVPVKLFSLNLLLMAIFFATPDIHRMSDFFVFNKSVQPLNLSSRFEKQTTKAILHLIKIGLTLWILFSITRIMRYKYSSYGDGAFSQTPLFGIYQTELFIKNKDTLLPLLTDTSQWKTVNLVYKNKARIRMMNDSVKECRFIIDTFHTQIQFAYETDTAYTAMFLYSIQDSNHLLIRGKWKEDSIHILLRKRDINQYRLVNKGFHWVYEMPDSP